MPSFSNSSDKLALTTEGTLAVFSADDLRPLWQVPKGSWIPSGVFWSSDDSVVMLFYENLGTILHDARSGQRIATIRPASPGAFATQENVLPDLRHRVSRANGTWELSALPAPDRGKPAESLSRVLTEAGLELRGVELVDSVPSASEASSKSKGPSSSGQFR